ncbi:hypothetical protein EYC56_00785 [Xanthomonas oryzae]|nr:hypothetical protein EYC56_00785 [Xanthomonas oryzae]
MRTPHHERRAAQSPTALSADVYPPLRAARIGCDAPTLRAQTLVVPSSIATLIAAKTHYRKLREISWLLLANRCNPHTFNPGRINHFFYCDRAR